MSDPRRFLPSRHGFAFTNAWPSQPAVVLDTHLGRIDIGNAAAGLCGGMVFVALDYWHAAVVPPTTRPAPGEPLYRQIVRRLIESWNLPAGVARYYQCMNLPDGDTGVDVLGRRIVVDHGLAWRTAQVQWPRIRADLDRGIPSPLGVVTVASSRPADLALNHQVLAYDYERSGAEVSVRVYDPTAGSVTTSGSASTPLRRRDTPCSLTRSASAIPFAASSAPITAQPLHRPSARGWSLPSLTRPDGEPTGGRSSPAPLISGGWVRSHSLGR